MTNTNGRARYRATFEVDGGKLRVILYARVSTEAQRERGLSIPGQFRELRAWAEREGYEVVAEIADEGGKNSKRDVLDRPGINRVLDACERQRINLVVAQDRDRFGEHPVPDMLAYMLAKHGTRLATPDGWDDDDEGAQLLRLVGDWNSGRERRKTARRSRSKKLEQARQGRIIPSHTPAYGYAFAGEKMSRAYEVDEQRMAVVRRVMNMVGVERLGIRTVAKRLTDEGVPLPPAPEKIARKRSPAWNRQFLKDLVSNDLYRPHDRREIARMVSEGLMAPDVASRAPDPCGVWMYTGQDYDGNAHRVAVPVPDAGNERASVEAARRYLANNRAPSTAGNRPFWELSGGILFCGCCGRRMVTHTPHSGRTKTGNSYSYHRYRCVGDTDLDKGRCEVRPRVPAEKTEEAVWDLVSSLASDSGLMVSRLDRLIEAERLRLRGDPKAEEEKMRERLADLDRRADNLHNAVIDALEEGGILQRERFEQRLRAIEERREATERELEAWGRRGERMHALEAMRDAYSGELMRDAFADHPDVPVNEIQERFMERVRVTRKEKVLDQYTPEQRHQLYREHEVRVEAKSKDELEVSGVFGSEFLYIGAGSSSGRFTPKTPPRRWTASSTSSRLTSSPR